MNISGTNLSQGIYTTKGNGTEKTDSISSIKKNNIYDNTTLDKDILSDKDFMDAFEKVNKEFLTYDRRLEFSIHEGTNEVMVKVIDVHTDEVIREVPPQKILDLVAKLWEVAGLILDEKI
ncbi:flagellar protein FlaG [Gottschalkia purinilytica]|uniref:Flagellar protein FlaG n=1 Tax=Gottschalkia purinilytica TaxID=1503 RepID=A0A0L0WDZ5_GOTPU|nr:flagellar protein FlaG [Gottschalkia purinilytica]KNF09640.1 flagellar protein FlaG [Gottschalkia purinilytica]